MNDTNSFNEELMKMLQESYEEDNDDVETCLISGEKLEDNHVKLECNHKFNYKHIYNEVYKQKTQPWHSEINKVKTTQLKCPYCRNIQTGLLPYREGCVKVKYVNWPPSLMMLPDECGYIFLRLVKEKAKLVVKNVVVNIVYHMKKSCLNVKRNN